MPILARLRGRYRLVRRLHYGLKQGVHYLDDFIRRLNPLMTPTRRYLFAFLEGAASSVRMGRISRRSRQLLCTAHPDPFTADRLEATRRLGLDPSCTVVNAPDPCAFLLALADAQRDRQRGELRTSFYASVAVMLGTTIGFLAVLGSLVMGFVLTLANHEFVALPLLGLPFVAMVAVAIYDRSQEQQPRRAD